MNVSSIHQKIFFNTSAQRMYDMIMDEALHSTYTESDVIMSNDIKGKFEIFDGYCQGFNIELVKGKKIVQAWHFEEDGWPDEHYSICTFTFNEKGKDACELDFIQENIPSHKKETLKEGWKKYYWEPIKRLISSD